MDTWEKLEWTALEYEDKNRSRDWFWALGVIVVTSAIASIIFGDYFFAVLIVLGGGLLGFFAIKKPDTIHYELNEKGLKIGSELYPYENIKSFWVQEMPAILFIKSERIFMPIISIPIEHSMLEEVHDVFTFVHVPEEEMKEHASDKIMESLGF